MYCHFALLRKYASTEDSFLLVLHHSLEVLAKSIEIINRKQLYDRVDLDLIVSGALLHDIGTFEFLEDKSKEGYICHGVIGAAILEKEGLMREALIAKRHTGSGISREDIAAAGWPLPDEDLLPLSLEEKIICYADKFSSKNPDKHDTPETILKEFESYGAGSLARFLALKEMFD